MTNLLLALVFAHLVGDFFLQDDWMAQNKSNPHSTAGYVHAFVQAALVAGACGSFGVGPRRMLVATFATLVTHWWIDLRSGLSSWRKAIGQTTDASLPHAPAFFIFQDQAAHGIVIVVLAYLLGR